MKATNLKEFLKVKMPKFSMIQFFFPFIFWNSYRKIKFRSFQKRQYRLSTEIVKRPRIFSEFGEMITDS